MDGRQIRQRRKALKMSQAELAAAIGMPGSQTYIGKVERGEVIPTVPTLERFATALGLELQVRFIDPKFSGSIEVEPVVAALEGVA